MNVNFYYEPFCGSKALETICQRDLDVIDEKDSFYTYVSTEVMLAISLIAQIVETVVRIVLAIVIIPFKK